MRATRESWKHVPFQEGTPIPYWRVFDEAAFARLRDGLVPIEMEDKWFIYFEEPYLLLHRSWTGKAYYRVALQVEGTGAQVTEALLSGDVASRDAEDHAAILAWVVGGLLLDEDVPLPALISD